MYKQFENDIRAWAENEPGVQALVVIGSRAREDHIADKWSDLDLILFVFDQEGWAENDAWLAYFGEVWLSQLRIAGSGMPEWFVIYKGGFKVDFLIAKAKNNLEKALYDSPFDVLVQRGLGILVNKSVSNPGQPMDDEIVLRLPGENSFEEVVKSFFLSTYRAAGLLRRGDLWRARKIIDGPMRGQLVDMMAWHAQAKNDPDPDTWYEGRFMEEWADPRALGKLPVLFAPFEITESARALGEMLSLFSWLVEETAENIHHSNPAKHLIHVVRWIELTVNEIVREEESSRVGRADCY